MATLNFYKDTVNGVWIFDDEVYPQGRLALVLIDETTVNFRRIENNVPYDKTGVKISDIKDADGVSYLSLNDLISRTAAFFTNETDLTSLISAVTSSGGSQFKTFQVEITRPANTTAYSPNDVVADVSAAFVQFANVAKSTGSGVKIIRVRIQTEDTGVSGTKFNVHLYKEAPTFIADNAAFAISYANATKRIGAIPIIMGTGNQNTVGMNDYNQMITNPTARDIYWILETVTGFTPSANSTKFTIAIDVELSN